MIFQESKTELFRLIETLDADQKRLYCQKFDNEKEQEKTLEQKLFDIIESAGFSDEEDIKKQLKIKSASQYSTVKRKLFENTLSIAVQCKNEKDKFITIEKLIYLIKNQLFKTATSYIKILKQDSISEQNFIYYHSVLKQEYRLLLYSDDRKYKEKLIQQEILIEKSLEDFNTFEKLSKLFRKLLLLKGESNNRIEGDEFKGLKEIASTLKEIEKEKIQQPVLNIQYDTSLALTFYLGMGEIEPSLIPSIIESWSNHQHLAPIFPLLFLESASIVFYIDFRQNKTISAVRHFQFFEKISDTLCTEDKQRWKIIAYNTQIKIYHKTAVYDKLKNYLKSNKNTLAQSMKYFTINEVMTFYTTECISYFVLEDFARADELMYQLKELNQSKLRLDIYYFSLIFHLLIMYELKDWYRLYINIDAAYQQLHKIKTRRPFEKELMLFLKKFSIQNNPATYPKVVLDFLEKMEAYTHDAVKKQYFLYFNYYFWLQSKTERISYMGFMKKKFQGS
ncbi:MAG: hypothetical protein IPH58_03335 [Sphingobacteriales bacterium]|jgi:hypothetical protein|nr:hypothetical protein [Sphingobacteriales bacterium]